MASHVSNFEKYNRTVNYGTFFYRGQQHFKAETGKSKEYLKFLKIVFLRSGEYLSVEIQFRKIITATATWLSKYCIVH